MTEVSSLFIVFNTILITILILLGNYRMKQIIKDTNEMKKEFIIGISRVEKAIIDLPNQQYNTKIVEK